MCKNKKSLSNRRLLAPLLSSSHCFALKTIRLPQMLPGAARYVFGGYKATSPELCRSWPCRHEALGQPPRLWGTQPCLPTFLMGSQPRHPVFLLCCISFQNILADSKEPACQCRSIGCDPWVGKVPWRRAWQPTPVFLPGASHGQRSPAGYRP